MVIIKHWILSIQSKTIKCANKKQQQSQTCNDIESSEDKRLSNEYN